MCIRDRFDSITSELIDLEKEFEKYYSFEYNSIEQFLWKKYNIKEEYILELMEEKKNNPDCKLFRKDELSYGDDSIAQFTFSDPIYQRIIDILMLK
jgi:hypothetical protein